MYPRKIQFKYKLGNRNINYKMWKVGHYFGKYSRFIIHLEAMN